MALLEQDRLYSSGCSLAAKSTNGGVIMLGKHYSKCFSSTHNTLALSSGEAELTAVVKWSCEAIRELWWMKLERVVLVNSLTALSVWEEQVPES